MVTLYNETQNEMVKQQYAKSILNFWSCMGYKNEVNPKTTGLKMQIGESFGQK